MADHQVIINSQIYKLIPLGLCKCGCERKTSIAKATHRKRKLLKGRAKMYISGHNKAKNSRHLRGGHITAKGYIRILKPNHHLSDQNGYVYEHRLIAETILGRKLVKGETIHHKNGDKTDNRPENLAIFNGSGEHTRFHYSLIPKKIKLKEPIKPRIHKRDCNGRFSK